jgi:hypothetical protein
MITWCHLYLIYFQLQVSCGTECIYVRCICYALKPHTNWNSIIDYYKAYWKWPAGTTVIQLLIGSLPTSWKDLWSSMLKHANISRKELYEVDKMEGRCIAQSTHCMCLSYLNNNFLCQTSGYKQRGGMVIRKELLFNPLKTKCICFI